MTYNPKYFKWSEFDQACLPGSGEQFMDRTFIQLLDQLRELCGFPLVVTSGYRSSAYNMQVSDTGENGPHTTGKAADISICGNRAHTLVKHAMALGFTGIGVSQRGEHNKRFIHLDTLYPGDLRPWIWSY
jgi:zinc D-Ala-D-Ala carboxypeptidase